MSDAKPVRISLDEATDYCIRVLCDHSTSPANAEPVARALVAAEADGLAGHGLSRLESYAGQAATGKVRPGMLLTSDSSFLFHVAELEVAVRKNLPLVCVVGVDFQWGLEVHGGAPGNAYQTFSESARKPRQSRGMGRCGVFSALDQRHYAAMQHENVGRFLERVL